jgi:single-stranded DNA-binding protein
VIQTNLNKYICFARIVSEIKILNSEAKIIGFSIVVPSQSKNNSDTFFNCKAFGKPAEVLEKYIRKVGVPIIITDAYFATDHWKDKTSNEDRKKLYLIIKEFSFIMDKKFKEKNEEVITKEEEKIVEKEIVVETTSSTVDEDEVPW